MWEGGRQVMSRVSPHPPSHPCTSLGGAGNRNWISPPSAFPSPKQDRYPPPRHSSMCSVFLLYCHIAPSNNTVLKIAKINFRAFLDLLAPKPLVLWSRDTFFKDVINLWVTYMSFCPLTTILVNFDYKDWPYRSLAKKMPMLNIICDSSCLISPSSRLHQRLCLPPITVVFTWA